MPTTPGRPQTGNAAESGDGNVVAGNSDESNHEQMSTDVRNNLVEVRPQPPYPPTNAIATKHPTTPPHQSHAVPMISSSADETEPYGVCSKVLIVVAYVFTIITFPISVFACIKVVQQYERAVIFRLGQLKKGGAKGPGLFFVIPFIDEYKKIDLRVVSYQIPPQEILSKDSVTVEVDAVVYFRICNATISIVNIENSTGSTRLLAQTTLRNILGTKTLSEMLSDRDNISHQMQAILDEATEHWGVKVERVELKDVRLPKQMQRAMAAEAEANREAKAKVIAAEGEQKASKALREAALTLSDTPSALQLRYLQTLSTISAEHNSTVIFPFPIDLMSTFMPQYQNNQRPQQQGAQQPPVSIQGHDHL